MTFSGLACAIDLTELKRVTLGKEAFMSVKIGLELNGLTDVPGPTILPLCQRSAMTLPLPVIDSHEEYEKKEKCGVFGIWGPKDAASIAYHGIFAQQHRGQESAGIAVTNGVELNGHTGMGLVSQVFNPRMLREELMGHAAIGHVRYSTTGSSKLCNAQPLLRQYSMGPVAVAHNGNLVNANLLRSAYEAHGHIFQSTTDTEVIVHLLAKPSHVDKADPLLHVLKHLQGAF